MRDVQRRSSCCHSLQTLPEKGLNSIRSWFVTLPETNIAMENPPFWWYLPGKWGFSWAMLVSGRVIGILLVNCGMPWYWFVNRNPYGGLLWIPTYHWVGFHPYKNRKQPGFSLLKCCVGHTSCDETFRKQTTQKSTQAHRCPPFHLRNDH